MSDRGLHNQARATLQTAAGPVTYYRLAALEEAGVTTVAKLPYSIRVLLENQLRKVDDYMVHEADVLKVAGWKPEKLSPSEVPFMPARVLLQDLTGIPVVVDLAAMRDAMAKQGGDPRKVNPIVPTELVIDHSVQVDFFGTNDALSRNIKLEYERNGERYALLRWASQSFENVRVLPPDAGICHQVNLEYLASCIMLAEVDGEKVAYPDTVVGADSHTTMINGLSVLGWGVGGIEAELVMLGQPYYMSLPEVVGCKLTGALPEGATATDLVLTIVEALRKKGVVEKFVEYFGPGVSNLALADRATIGNMGPEYGATCGFFAIDDETLNYLRGTGRSAEQVDLVERYAKANQLFRTDGSPDPEYTDVVEIDMSKVVPCISGPSRPQDYIALSGADDAFEGIASRFRAGIAPKPGTAKLAGGDVELEDGVVTIAAITSCTNTSNPSVMVGAGLLAKKALEKGLSQKPWVKTSLAPGSQVVTDYLTQAGLLPYLEQMGFNVVGYGCTTCIGNSGPLPEAVASAVEEGDLVATAVLSGNRNFQGRIHPLVKANFLASPVLVVAYALAGSLKVNLTTDSLGTGKDGRPVYLRDIWPSQGEVADVISKSLNPDMYRERYAAAIEGDEEWKNLPVPAGDLFQWDPESTYVRPAPYFDGFTVEPAPVTDILGARALAVLGDMVTTDDISPAGSIPGRSPAADYLRANGVKPLDFNIYGTRRGNHEVMVRGTYGNIRLRNKMTPEMEGDWTLHLPEGALMRIFEASEKYHAEGTPLVVIAGKECGTGSSRDWAAKGPKLLGVRACIAESFERIHRSNLIGMGILPLVFKPGENAITHQLTGHETFDIVGIAGGVKPGQDVTVKVTRESGDSFSFTVTCRVDTPVEADYYAHDGVLPRALRTILKQN